MEKKDKEIRLLKKIIKAQTRLLVCYRIGKVDPPAWVFTTIREAHEKYGYDLEKI